jgi:predicted ATPase
VLREALDGLAARRGTVIELTGDPGIGKTRLLTEFSQEAVRRGFDVLRGNATEFERDLPFGVFVSALADRYHRPGPDPVSGGPGETAAADAAKEALAALLHGEGAQTSGAERFRVYAAVRELLADWAGGGLVLMLDDMHWADPGAVELAEYLVRRPLAAALREHEQQRGRQAAARLAGTLARGIELG